jgi:membrane-associated phospholipid phosphatase
VTHDNPLDQDAANRLGWVRVARIYSNVVSPPIAGAILGITAGLTRGLPFLEGFAWAAVYGLLVSLAPILYVVWLLKTGRIQELHMSNTKERHLPYIAGILTSLLVYAITQIFDGPELIGCLALFNALQLACLAIINVYWLISFHTCAIAATGLVFYLVFGAWTMWLTIPIFLSVAYVRLYLRRHTPAQVIAGTFLGLIVVWVMTLFGCFI